MPPKLPPKQQTSGLMESEGLRQRLHVFFLTKCDPPEFIGPGAQNSESSEPGGAATGQLVGDGRYTLVFTVDMIQLLNACWELTDPLLNENTLGTMDMLRAEVAQLFSLQTKKNNDEEAVAALTTRYQRSVMASDISLRWVHAVPQASFVVGQQGSDSDSSLKSRGILCTLTGTMVRLAPKRVVPASSTFRCGKCGATTEKPSNPFYRNEAIKPRCDQKSCKGEVLQLVSQTWMDYAECRLQQRIEMSGKLPRSVLVTLDDDLSTKCSVGQVVHVVGVVKERWRNVYNGATPVVEMVVWASNVIPIDVSSRHGAASASDEESRQSAANRFRPEDVVKHAILERSAFRVSLVLSSCPQLCGLFAPRLGLLLAAVDGTSSRRGTGSSATAHKQPQREGGVGIANTTTTTVQQQQRVAHRVRSTIHMLLVGDPSTGKSQLLRFAAAIAPRSTSTTGVTTTSAGLTVAAAKEMGEWVLEPGALVLSDGGTCCIDELRTVSAADRTSLHEAMEQQTISVAKAGLVTRLRTVCSVIAACNPPMSRRNPYGRLSTEIGVGGPLLSRFDLIFLMWDYAGEETDDIIASHILECSAAAPEAPFTMTQLSQFLAYTRAKYNTTHMGQPLLDDDAAQMLGRYYEALRRRGPPPSLCDAIPVTVRLLESMVRLTQAHAKLLHEERCGWRDAAMAIFLLEHTAHALKFRLDDDTLNTFFRAKHDSGEEKELYSSSRCLDDLFLEGSPKSLSLQHKVLTCIAQRFIPDGSSEVSAPGKIFVPSGEDERVLLTSCTVASSLEDDSSRGSRKRSRDDTNEVLSSDEIRDEFRPSQATMMSRSRSSSSCASLTPPASLESVAASKASLQCTSVACYEPTAFHARASPYVPPEYLDDIECFDDALRQQPHPTSELLEFGDEDPPVVVEVTKPKSQPLPPAAAAAACSSNASQTAAVVTKRTAEEVMRALKFRSFSSK